MMASSSSTSSYASMLSSPDGLFSVIGGMDKSLAPSEFEAPCPFFQSRIREKGDLSEILFCDEPDGRPLPTLPVSRRGLPVPPFRFLLCVVCLHTCRYVQDCRV